MLSTLIVLLPIGLVIALVLNKIKPVRKCAACRSRVAKEATVCPRCGRDLV